jgi:hypothetical protein
MAASCTPKIGAFALPVEIHKLKWRGDTARRGTDSLSLTPFIVFVLFVLKARNTRAKGFYLLALAALFNSHSSGFAPVGFDFKPHLAKQKKAKRADNRQRNVK